MRRFTATATGVLLWTLSAAAPVAAQTTAAILPTFGGHREIPSAVRDQAYQAATEFLRTEDLVVLEPARVETALRNAGIACPTAGEPCAEARAHIGTDFLVGLVIWGTSDAPATASSVHASIVDATGTRFVGSVTVTSGQVATAVRDALRTALRNQRRGPGPFLEILGTRGAAIELDGAAVGSVPSTLRTDPGEHEIRVTLRGHEPQTLNITIPEDPAHTTQLEIVLRRSVGASGEEPTRPDLLANLLLGGSIAVLGVVTVAVHPIPTLVRDGECVERGPTNDTCNEWVGFDAGAGVLFAAGTLALATGVVIAIAQPITIHISAAPSGARFELGGSF